MAADLEKSVSLTKAKNSKIFPGWWILLTASFLMFWAAGLYTYAFSALLKPLAADLGFSRAQATIPSGIGRMEGGFEGLVAGYLSDRFGPKRVVFVGTFVGGLGLILMYFVQSLWAYVVFWGLMFATGYNLTVGVPMQTSLTNWFLKKRGIVLGIQNAAAAVGGVVVLPLIAWLIVAVGWRMACVIGGLGLWLIGLPLIVIFMKERRPEYYGLFPDGATVKAGGTSETIDSGVKYAAGVGEVEFTLRQAMRTSAFWLFMIVAITSGMAFIAVYTHAVSLMTDLGVEPVRAAGIVGLTIFFGIPARIGGGWIADLLRKERMRFGVGAGYLIQAIAFPAFVLYPTPLMAFVWLSIFMLGTGISGAIFTPIVGRYFGRKAFGSIWGTKMMFAAPGSMLAPILLGWAYDTTGSYIIALAIIIGLLFFAGLILLLAVPPKPPAHIGDIRQFV